MIRVLHIFHNMGNGGIEHFVMELYRHIDRDKVKIGFVQEEEKEKIRNRLKEIEKVY